MSFQEKQAHFQKICIYKKLFHENWNIQMEIYFKFHHRCYLLMRKDYLFHRNIFFQKNIHDFMVFVFYTKFFLLYKNKFLLNEIKFLYYRLLIANLLYLLFKQKYI